MEPNKLFHIQALALCLALVALQPIAQAADVDSVCAFSKDPKPALHLDPWARTGEKVKRFGSTENSDEVLIQSCKNIDGKFIALSLGNKEPSLANDSASILFREDLGTVRCEISSTVADNRTLAAKRTALKISRLQTLRSCVALEVVSLNSRPLILGNHPSCQWESVSANRYLARGTTCTVRADRGIAISVRPVFESKCLDGAAFERGEVRAADRDTVQQRLFPKLGTRVLLPKPLASQNAGSSLRPRHLERNSTTMKRFAYRKHLDSRSSLSAPRSSLNAHAMPPHLSCQCRGLCKIPANGSTPTRFTWQQKPNSSRSGLTDAPVP